MKYREFPRLDEATVQNLRTLESHAQQDGAPGDVRLIDMLIVSSIDVLGMLPPVVARHFNRGRFYTHGTHYKATPERRMEIWAQLASSLDASLDAVEAEITLCQPSAGGERPQTSGERIIELCREFLTAFSGGTDTTASLAKLELEASGTAAYGDVKELQKLLKMKRIPNADQWRADVHRAAGHASIVARQLHGSPARFPAPD